MLDNFEHLTRGGAQIIASILQYAPQMKLIITSRERLHLRGEWVIDLHGLVVPEDTQTAAPEKYSAVQLFVEALERVRAGQPVTAAKMEDIVRICQLVRGMPLALELAASWGGVLSCADIAAEIQHSLDFLASAYRDLPARHQSLRAVFQHSWELLTEEEQEAFQRLAVFRGGFGRTAAREVAGAPLLLLHSLASKSLLRVGESGRYSIHPLLRQFAREQLRADEEIFGVTQRRHAQFYAAFVGEHAQQLKKGGEQKTAVERADQEIENVRLAWRWALAQGEYGTILAAAEGLYHFFATTNRVREGSQTVGRVINDLRRFSWDGLTLTQRRLMGMARGLEARFHHIMGHHELAREGFEEGLRILEGDGSAAELAFISLLAIPGRLGEAGLRPEELYQRCLSYYQAHDDRWGIASAHMRYVDYLRSTQTGDDHGVQRELMTQSLAIREAIGDQRGVANTLNYLCDLAYAEGEYEDARKWAAQSLTIHQTLDNQIGRAHSLNHLGQVAGSLGSYEEARQAYQESLGLLRNFGNPREVATALDCVGYVTYLMDEYSRAEPYYRESLEISREIGDVHGEAWSLHNLGDIERARGAYEAAQQLYEESCRLHQESDPLSWGGAVALDKLGRVTLLMGEAEKAERHFREALRIAIVTGRTREALDALFNLGHLFMRRGDVDEAAEMLQIIVYHPATAKETLDAAERKLSVGDLRLERPGLSLLEMSERLLNGELSRL